MAANKGEVLRALHDEPSPDEREIHRTGLHWAALLGPAILAVAGAYLFPAKGLKSLILIALALFWGTCCWFNLKRSEFVITEKHFIARTGFIIRRSVSVDLTKISYADTFMPVLGRLLNFGKLVVTVFGTSSGVAFRLVAKPIDFLDAMKTQIRKINLAGKDAEARDGNP